MKKPLIVGNWKMNLDRAAAVELAGAISGRCHAAGEVDLAVCPPAVYLDAKYSFDAFSNSFSCFLTNRKMLRCSAALRLSQSAYEASSSQILADPPPATTNVWTRPFTAIEMESVSSNPQHRGHGQQHAGTL